MKCTAPFERRIGQHRKLDVRFAGKDAAVATVTSRMSTFTSPDGIKHLNEQHIRTLVLAKRGTRWLIMQDQNTLVTIANALMVQQFAQADAQNPRVA